MKRFCQLICSVVAAALAVVSCVNSDYDLNNLNTDNTTLGGQNSVIEAPLMKVTLTLDDLIGGETTRATVGDELTIEEILELFNQITVLLPSDLLDGETIDLLRIAEYPEDSYLRDIVSSLFEEINEDEDKFNEVVDVIWDNFIEYFSEGSIDTSSKEAFAADLKRILSQSGAEDYEESQEYEDILTEIADVLSEYLFSYMNEGANVEVDLSDFADSDDATTISDLLLGGDSNIKQEYILNISGHSDLNIGIEIKITCEGTSIDSTIQIAPNSDIAKHEILILKEDLEAILSGKASLSITGTITSLDPTVEVDENSGITIIASVTVNGGTLTL